MEIGWEKIPGRRKGIHPSKPFASAFPRPVQHNNDHPFEWIEKRLAKLISQKYLINKFFHLFITEVCVNQTNLVNDFWAISLIRSAANKYYKEKIWSADQFNDLIHTLLVQRPAQKSFLLNVLLKDHGDKQAWERWRNFVSSDRIHMSKLVLGMGRTEEGND